MLMPDPSVNEHLQPLWIPMYAFEFYTVTRFHTLPPERPLFLQLSLSTHPAIGPVNHCQAVLLWL